MGNRFEETIATEALLAKRNCPLIMWDGKVIHAQRKKNNQQNNKGTVKVLSKTFNILRGAKKGENHEM